MPDLSSRKRFILIILLIIIITVPLIVFKYNDLVKFISKNGLSSLPPSALTGNVNYGCPSVKSFCESGKDLSLQEEYLGFGNNLASGSAILASFDGNLTSTTTILPPSLKSESLITLYLDNPENDLRAVYFFKGESSASRKVTRGEKIGRSLTKIQAFDTSLVFQIIKGDKIKGERLHLTAKDFN